MIRIHKKIFKNLKPAHLNLTPLKKSVKKSSRLHLQIIFTPLISENAKGCCLKSNIQKYEALLRIMKAA